MYVTSPLYSTWLLSIAWAWMDVITCTDKSINIPWIACRSWSLFDYHVPLTINKTLDRATWPTRGRAFLNVPCWADQWRPAQSLPEYLALIGESPKAPNSRRHGRQEISGRVRTIWTHRSAGRSFFSLFTRLIIGKINKPVSHYHGFICYIRCIWAAIVTMNVLWAGFDRRAHLTAQLSDF